MNIVIFGANGATGKILTKQALDSGHRVTAVTRHPEALPLRDVRLNVMGGDVIDLALVEQAVAGQMPSSPLSVSPLVANRLRSIRRAWPILCKP
jgi:dTDP-4-dehydrorhamnose reductase